MAHNPNKNDDRSRDRNEDPITGEPGAHPVGAGLGAAAGGAAAGAAGAAAGAAMGAPGGPIGAAVGAIVGGVAGGLGGKAIAEHIDPTAEDAYWRKEYRNRDYYDSSVAYDDIQPAYRFGWESRGRYGDRTWDVAEPEIKRDWETSHGKSNKSLTWERAKRPVRDAWDHIERAMPGDADGDGR